MSQDTHFDAVFVGTGFATSFYLYEYLKRAPAHHRVLVLERGEWKKKPDGTPVWPVLTAAIPTRKLNLRGWHNKKWIHTIAFGGSSNCWWGCTPRFMPNDFKLKSTYGVGYDWPMDYNMLEPFYQEAEEIMDVSGPSETPYPRAARYPQPPHRFSDPEREVKKHYPDQFISMPTARARVATDSRNACCGNATCGKCPVNAKFTIANGFKSLYADPRVHLETMAEVIFVDVGGGMAKGVHYRQFDEEKIVSADFIALGANALYNPFLLLKSGITHPLLGRRLNEQVTSGAYIYLDGLDNFQGSTSLTAHGYMLYDGVHRARYGGCLIESSNIPVLRMDPGKWRQVMVWKLIVENLPEERSGVTFDQKDPDRPTVRYDGHSQYGLAGIEAARAALPGLLKSLPVEKIEWGSPSTDEGHNIGTVVMGNDPDKSVVDRKLLCHNIRNLAVLGASAFPSSSPANPTLTLSALSLYAARQL